MIQNLLSKIFKRGIKMRKKCIAMSSLLLGGAMVISAANANAFIIDWADTLNYSIVSVTDPTDANGGRDITKAWSATDGANYYFRMDLADSPYGTSANAGIYGIYIDAVAGGANSGHTYVPATPTSFSTDHVLDGHYDSNQTGFFKSDYHVWNGSLMEEISIPSHEFQYTANDGKTLEWKIAVSALGTGFNWFAASHDHIQDVVQLTWDRTGTMSPAPAPVPVPAAAWLLGSGLVGLVSFRRRS
ncbi:MAG: VPLPA-CTERM sorting domain-containing protein [Sulfuricurvum sp.]|nr:VPLPA-CTERM sorting domain-containing protein [Sulfuricurvum sp.]